MSKQRSSNAPKSAPVHEPVWRDASWRSRIRRRLLGWFDRHARDLPWRANRSPYRVWVSEIMLQQTQVATVIPYYERFLQRFPSVEALADADEQVLLSHWEGLGYYRRARSMHAAARRIVDQHDGVFPEAFEDALALPGIGRYTAGAILSIATNQRLPIVEGNTQRVFSRWVAMRGVATEPPATKLLWEIADAMLPRKRPGDFNQAAMELGALICAPKAPLCQQCPVEELCCARQKHLQEEIPGKVTRVVYEDRKEFALVIADCAGARSRTPVASQKFLVRPLPEGGRWAGLWDFPRTTDKSLDSASEAASWLSQQLGVPMSPGIRLTTIRHAVTKYRIELHVHLAELDARGKAPGRPWRYVSLSEMTGLPMSVTGRKIAKLLSGDRQSRLPLQGGESD